MLVRVIKYFQVQGLKLMGKQINYYMEYDSFILLAKKAIELGCEIIPFSAEVLNRGCSLDMVSKENRNYCFHVPEAGEIKKGGPERPPARFNDFYFSNRLSLARTILSFIRSTASVTASSKVLA